MRLHSEQHVRNCHAPVRCGQSAPFWRRVIQRNVVVIIVASLAACGGDGTTSGKSDVSLTVSPNFTAALSGPSTIPTGVGRLFRTATFNGVGPYTFEWRQWGGGAPAKIETITQPYQDSYFSIYTANPGSIVHVEVRVTDGTGATFWTTLTTQSTGTIQTNCTWQVIRNVTQPPVPPGPGNSQGLICTGSGGGGPL